MITGLQLSKQLLYISFISTFDFFFKSVAFSTEFTSFLLPFIIIDLPIFPIAEWVTLLMDIRCPRGDS